MAQSLTAKQTLFVQRYSAAATGLLAVADELSLLNKEFADMTYGTGGANALTDAIIQTTLPASTAALFNSGEAGIVNVLTTVGSVRSALEFMRQ